VDVCAARHCLLEQKYSEGSSWSAYGLTDLVVVGGEDAPSSAAVNATAVRVRFGCQSSITGLFRTQLANGIMGLSGTEGTLPSALRESGRTRDEIFGLCFRATGGTMTMGGIDPSLFAAADKGAPPTLDGEEAVYSVFATAPATVGGALSFVRDSPAAPGAVKLAHSVKWAKLARQDGWFTVKVLGVFLVNNRSARQPNATASATALRDTGATFQELNGGKGAILDSGTTDTFLPSSIARKFKQVFEDLTGLPFSNRIALTAQQRLLLPDIVVRLRGFSPNDVAKRVSGAGKEKNPKSAAYYNRLSHAVDVVMTAPDYLHHVKGSSYELNVFLSEAEGLVLGANFMNRKYVIFDRRAKRVGFASSACGGGGGGAGGAPAAGHAHPPVEKGPTRLRGAARAGLNTSEAEYWRLIGWRRRAREEAQTQTQARAAGDASTLLSPPPPLPYEYHAAAVETRRLRSASPRPERKDQTVHRSVIEHCRRQHALADPASTEGGVASAVPSGPCSAACARRGGGAGGLHGGGAVYSAFGEQKWQCMWRDVNRTKSQQRGVAASLPTRAMSLPCSMSCLDAAQTHTQAGAGAGEAAAARPSFVGSSLFSRGCPSDEGGGSALRGTPPGTGTGTASPGKLVSVGSWSLCNASCVQARWVGVGGRRVGAQTADGGSGQRSIFWTDTDTAGGGAGAGGWSGGVQLRQCHGGRGQCAAGDSSSGDSIENSSMLMQIQLVDASLYAKKQLDFLRLDEITESISKILQVILHKK
jgi:hypothetical protein